MKISKILLAGIFILAIITLGAVSAAEDAGNLTVSDDEISIEEASLDDIEADAGIDDVLADKPSLPDGAIDIRIGEDEIPKDMYMTVYFDVSQNVTGFIQCQIDDIVDKENEPIELFWGSSSTSVGPKMSEFGNYTLKVKYFDGNYQDKTFEFPFKVNKNYYFEIGDNIERIVKNQNINGYYGYDYQFSIIIDNRATGRYDVYLNGNKFKTLKFDDALPETGIMLKIPAGDIKYGENEIIVKYTPKKGSMYKQSGEAKLVKNFTGLILSGSSFSYNSENLITLLLPEDEGYLSLKFDDNDEIKVPVSGGKAVYNASGLDVGYHSLIAKYVGDKYSVKDYGCNVHVSPKFKIPKVMWVKDDQKIEFETGSDKNGEVVVNISKYDYLNNFEFVKTLTFQVKDGKGVVDLNLDEGNYYFEVRGVDIDAIYTTEVATSNPHELDLDVYGYVYKLPEQDLLALNNYYDAMDENNFVLIIDNKTVYNDFWHVKYSQIDASNLDYGQHSYNFTYLGDENFPKMTKTGTFTVEQYVDISLNGADVLYSENSKYSVKINDINGKPVNGKKAIFRILDGEREILKKTVDVKNGVATLSYKITDGVKYYDIEVSCIKASEISYINVKHVVSLKAVKVKKSAKTITLQASLAKVNGKYLKGKKITFKFNGKTYTAKTNSKGVAKVTIKKSVLKKLKVGKKITYQATYMKDTVKKTVKVLK